MTDKQVSGTRVIDATPEAIFAVLADPTKHPLFDGSGTVRESKSSGGERLAMGSKFGMSMKMGVPYGITNTVVEFEEGRRIAWRHAGRHRWRYELEPVDGGARTQVTETFDWGPAIAGVTYPLVGIPAKNKKAIDATLERLDAMLASGTAG
ncbi:MAG TPA: SRPBCC family protein [Acidimicrobiales bacterium]|nr:SRPBCC family protein [Acidimicrobiales bacterium]